MIKTLSTHLVSAELFKVFFTLNIPAVHTIRVKQAGKYGASISMNMAMSLRTSAKSLVRN